MMTGNYAYTANSQEISQTYVDETKIILLCIVILSVYRIMLKILSFCFTPFRKNLSRFRKL